MIKVTSILNPAIFKNPTTGKTYVVAGDQPWMEVPDGTTLADIEWIPQHEPHKGTVDAQETVFQVMGTKGNKYTVKRSKNGEWSCECVGFGYRGKCRHIGLAAGMHSAEYE